MCGLLFDRYKWVSMKFSQFKAGQVIEAGPYTLTTEALLAFAKEYDPQWFHTDTERAEQGRHRGLIASGWQTCAIAMRLAVESVLADSESFASPGVTNVKWLHPVRANDQLRLTSTITQVRTSASRPELGIVHWHWRLVNQSDVTVLEVDATSLFDLSPA